MLFIQELFRSCKRKEKKNEKRKNWQLASMRRSLSTKTRLSRSFVTRDGRSEHLRSHTVSLSVLNSRTHRLTNDSTIRLLSLMQTAAIRRWISFRTNVFSIGKAQKRKSATDGTSSPVRSSSRVAILNVRMETSAMLLI